MSRILLFLVTFLIAVHCTFGQATSVERYRITNNTTAMGVNMPAGTQVFDVAGQKLYIALRPVPATITIQIGLEAIDPYFKEFAFVPEIPTAPDGTEVVELVSSSGRIWMDRNLGASQAATSETDHLAYGSLFQWCRAADGHEKITWTSSTNGVRVNSTTSTLSTSAIPGHSLFITGRADSYDWLNVQQADGSLWWNGASVGNNSPCPSGFHVPTKAEWDVELGRGISNHTTAFSALKLTLSGICNGSSGVLGLTGGDGYYWSSSVNSTRAWFLYFNNTGAYTNYHYRSFGFNVRCIKDL